MIQLMLGDCLERMKELDDNSVHSIVTDPPYGLSFMGKHWDKGVPSAEIWAEALRVLKPGGHLLAFAGTRTQHRMAVNIEDAGFEIRDMIAWVYGSGFSKSHNLKDKWLGWGTALKPALETVTVARKPFKGTVAANVQEHGTGAINIDGCRVGTDENLERVFGGAENSVGNWGMKRGHTTPQPSGRWPANFIHDGSDEVVGLFPVTGASKATNRGLQHSGRHGGLADIGGNIKEGTDTVRGHNDNGGSAARFFYCAKASKKDRDEGLDGFDGKPANSTYGAGLNTETKIRTDEQAAVGVPRELRKNNHPTVKPTALMRYLCRLVTPPNGIVLDPFMGSGSTGKAAMLEGFSFVGIELDPDYFTIAKQRIESAN